MIRVNLELLTELAALRRLGSARRESSLASLLDRLAAKRALGEGPADTLLRAWQDEPKGG